MKECVDKLKDRNAAAADEVVNEFLKYGGGRLVYAMFILYHPITENGYTAQRWREGVEVNILTKGETRLT